MAINKRGTETWEGGFVRRTTAGKAAYVIRRRIEGTLFEVSTRCTTLRAAMAELARFEADPHAYRPGGPTKSTLPAVLITASSSNASRPTAGR